MRTISSGVSNLVHVTKHIVIVRSNESDPIFSIIFYIYKIKYMFLKSKHASSTKAASAGVMQQYLGSNLGVTHADLASLEHKLSAQISEAKGSGATVGHLARERGTKMVMEMVSWNLTLLPKKGISNQG